MAMSKNESGTVDMREGASAFTRKAIYHIESEVSIHSSCTCKSCELLAKYELLQSVLCAAMADAYHGNEELLNKLGQMVRDITKERMERTKKTMTSDDVITLMKSSRSEKEWNDNCDRVKAAHNGEYPDYWYATMIISGLFNSIKEIW